MSVAGAFDELTVEALRARGSLKWTMHGENTLGAFVAEMDFPTAPSILHALHDAVDTMNFGYLPPALTTAMAQACAEWQRGRYGWNVSAEGIHPLPDVVKGFEVAIEHYAKPGSRSSCPRPPTCPS